MMRKYIHFLSLLLFMSSCEKDMSVKRIFDKSINQRVDSLTSSYLKVLTNTEIGWVGYYSPNKNAKVSRVLLNFKTDGSVSMRMEDNIENGVFHDDIVRYRIEKKLKINMVFETHGYLHKVFEKNSNNNKGEFVFHIDSVSSDEVVLTSKMDMGYVGTVEVTKLVLKKARKIDWKINKGNYDNFFNNQSQSSIFNVYINDKTIATFFYHNRFGILTYSKGERLALSSSKLAMKPNYNFSFFEKIKLDAGTLYDFVFNPVSKNYFDRVNNVKIISEQAPAFPLILPRTMNSIKQSRKWTYVLSTNISDHSKSFESILQRLNKSLRISSLQVIVEKEGTPRMEIKYKKLKDNRNFSKEIVLSLNFKKHEVTNAGRVYFEIESFEHILSKHPDSLRTLLDILFNNSSGYYMKHIGSYGNANSGGNIMTLIHANEPKYEFMFSLNVWR